MPGQFNTKVAVVTGAASGIGRATALAFAREGATVVVSDVASQGGEETVRLIKEAGGEATFVTCDVSQAEEVKALVIKAVDTYGRLDYDLNSAGIEGTQASTADYPEDVWSKVIGTNLTGPYLCMKYAIPQMLTQGAGVIVNMASILGVVGLARGGAYTAAKHGLVGLTKVAALEYATQGIRVNAVCPGFIETPMVMERALAAGSHPEVYQYLAELHPMKRLGKPEEIAAGVVWLCSEAASFVTGQTLIVDGGYTAQ
jgi:NAD(P)-dependent dehydrogenase (short-subunit alcohol dehydrogenase family)